MASKLFVWELDPIFCFMLNAVSSDLMLRVIRAMETVINQHGLDIEALKSSRLPLTGGPQIGN